MSDHPHMWVEFTCTNVLFKKPANSRSRTRVGPTLRSKLATNLWRLWVDPPNRSKKLLILVCPEKGPFLERPSDFRSLATSSARSPPLTRRRTARKPASARHVDANWMMTGARTGGRVLSAQAVFGDAQLSTTLPHRKQQPNLRRWHSYASWRPAFTCGGEIDSSYHTSLRALLA